uniref:TIL domain-containing protein n=1 Tax=Rhabditophanes sp. KR3021 TaxID=114890 RepID=A0AC35TXK1_9BILA
MLLFILLPCFYSFAVLISSQEDSLDNTLDALNGTLNETLIAEIAQIIEPKVEPNTSCFFRRCHSRNHCTHKPPSPCPSCPTCPPQVTCPPPLPCPRCPDCICPACPPVPWPTRPPVPCPTRPPFPDVCDRCENNCKRNKLCPSGQFPKYHDGHCYCACDIERCDNFEEVCSRQRCLDGFKPTVCGDFCICKQC